MDCRIPHWRIVILIRGDYSDSLWSLAGSYRDYRNPGWHFSWNVGLNIFVIKVCSFFVSIDFYGESWKPEVCYCRMCKTYIYISFDPTCQIWTRQKKSCFSFFVTIHCMKVECFYTKLIITFGLLECLNKSADIWGFLLTYWRDFRSFGIFKLSIYAMMLRYVCWGDLIPVCI